MTSKQLLAAELPAASDVLGNGLLLLQQGAIAEPALLFTLLMQEIRWQEAFITLYGKRHKIPRLQAWYGDPGSHYRYSGETLLSQPWTPTLHALTLELNQGYGTAFNAVLCNLYRNGQDSMGWHSDDEPELGNAPRILSLSLGATRDFALRPKGSSRQQALVALTDGSLLDMRPGLQSLWQHALPKRARVNSPRINLTFRQIQNPSPITDSMRNIITGVVS